MPSNPLDPNDWISSVLPKFKSPNKSAFDTSVGGSHYERNSIQPIEFILANKLNWCEANALKYICRHRNKNGKEDLEKAKHYIDLLIEYEYGAKRSDTKPTSPGGTYTARAVDACCGHTIGANPPVPPTEKLRSDPFLFWGFSEDNA